MIIDNINMRVTNNKYTSKTIEKIQYLLKYFEDDKNLKNKKYLHKFIYNLNSRSINALYFSARK